MGDETHESAAGCEGVGNGVLLGRAYDVGEEWGDGAGLARSQAEACGRIERSERIGGAGRGEVGSDGEERDGIFGVVAGGKKMAG